MSAPYTVLISGGTRGIGKGFVERYLSRPNHVVIAANRDPSSATSKALSHLPTAAGSRLIVVKLDAAVEADAAAVIRSLVDAYGITHLDLVIANAGTGLVYPAVRAARRADLQTHIEINVFGPLHLLQAALPLLEKAAAPKWVTIGSSAASMGEMPPVPNAVYGSSKAMLNWLTRRLHFEEEWLTSFVIHPGWIQTDGGLLSAKLFGLDEAMTNQLLLKQGESHPSMMKLIDEATRETHGGKFLNYDSKEIPW